MAALIIHAVAFAISVSESAQPAGDFDRYYAIASAEGRPYIDYQVEHPIGTLLVFKALARLPGGRASFGLAVVVLDLIAGAVIVGSLLWGWGVVAAATYAAVVAPVVGLFFNRVDAWSTAAAAIAVTAWRKNRPIALGCAIAIGAGFKLWPLVLATLLIVPWRAHRSVVALAAFAMTAAALAGGALWLAGSKGVLEVLTFRGATGWQIESLIGSLIHLAGSETIRMESGAWRIGTINGAASISLFAAAAPICIWSSWRGAQIDRLGAGWLASVSTLLVLSALLSPQYLIWLAPATGIAWIEGDTHLAVITAIAILLTQILWSSYGSLLASERAAVLTVVVRNAVLIALAVSAVASLSRRPRSR
jgi:Glycosyltransferase family 87